jgi:hypothetical protein
MSERLINLIANVDLKEGIGEILFANPLGGDTASAPDSVINALAGEGSHLAIAGGPSIGPAEYELVVEDAEGTELARYAPTIKYSQCSLAPDGERSEERTTGLIDEIIPYIEGMKRVRLLHDGKLLDTFEGGSSLKGAELGPVMLSEAAGEGQNRRMLRADIEPQSGVTFTVQVRPEATGAWETIAIGLKRPDVQIDRNQFPGVRRARVRVLRNSGFEDEVFVEQDVDLDFEE